MATMYFAKVNINSEVYNLYKNPNLAEKILDDLFLKLNPPKSPIRIERNGLVTFFDIAKNPQERYITGRLEKMSKVLRIDFTIIPPNGNEEEFNDLFPKNAEEIRETGERHKLNLTSNSDAPQKVTIPDSCKSNLREFKACAQSAIKSLIGTEKRIRG